MVISLVAAAGWVLPAAAAELQFAPDIAEGPYSIALDAPAPSAWPQGAELRIVFDYESSESFHAACLTRDGAWIERRVGGETRKLGPVGKWPDTDGTAALTVKRREWEIGILCNGRTVARGHDEEPFGGRIGLETTGVEVSASDLLVQPVEAPVLTDDFMRGSDEQGAWTVEAGRWENVGLAGGKGQLRADLSANPFSMRCQGDGPQLTTTGEWYWDSYSASVAAKATETGGAIGLAFCVQDASNYYLLSLGHRGLGSGLRLLRVVNGSPEAMAAAAGGYDADVWQKLTVRVSNGLIEGYLDGVGPLTALDATFGQGPVGLWAAGCGDGWFDDVEVRPWWAFGDPLRTGDLSAWLQAGGAWTAGEGVLRAASSFDKPGTILVGPRTWRNYEIAADVAPGDAEGVGLYACAEGASSCYLLRWSAGTPVGSWQLLRMGEGRPVVLGLAPGDLAGGSAQRLSMRVGDGLIDCRVNGQPVLAAADFGLTAGAAGLRADGGSAVRFSNVTVTAVEDPYRPIAITKQFAQEETMADWARPSSDWPLDPETRTRWFRLPLFGDLSVRIPFRPAPRGESRVTLHIGSVMQGEGYVAGGPQVYSPGLEVEYAAVDGGKITVTCRRGGQVLSQQETAAEGTTHVARVDKAGLTTRAWLDGEAAIAVNDGTWLDNSALGLSGEGGTVSLDRVETYSTHMPQYTFSGAPTDWRPQLGVWQVTDRWSCFPGWAWFGGTQHQSPLLWSKHQFYGDQTFEFWAGLEMDTTPNRGGYTHPSDINCTIAGDGKNLCSGYSFVFAGDSNTTTKILRGNQVVAQTQAARFINPTTGNFDFHRHWFHIKAVKVGSELHMAVDGKWVLRWQDPQPLAGGHVAVWTYNNNGILIAQARAAAQVVN